MTTISPSYKTVCLILLCALTSFAIGCAAATSGHDAPPANKPRAGEPHASEQRDIVLPDNMLVQRAAQDPGAARDLRIRLSWMTETEENSFCFFVYRSDDPEAEPELYNGENPVAAHGTTQIPHKYYFYDLNVAPDGVYYYKLQLVNLDGSTEWVFGEPEPLTGRSKPLTDEDRALLAEHGQISFSVENF